MTCAVPDIRERWRTSFIERSTYERAVEHEHMARVLGRLIWGTDTAAFYRDIARLSSCRPAPASSTSPCVGGVAFRRLGPDRSCAMSPWTFRR